MFKNYLKMAFRTIIKNKGFSIINILGLSIGLTCCILILLWVGDELSFDRFHTHFDELYRVEMLLDHPSGLIRMPITPSPLAAVLKNDYPEVKEVVRFTQGGDRLIKYGEKRFFSRVTAADPTIFNMFSFTLLKGNPKTAFSEKYSIVMTESTGKKYFAGEEPLGKILDLGENSFKVTGILQDIPLNSHLQFDCLIPFNTAVKPSVQGEEGWHEASYYTYVQLRGNTSYQEFNPRIAGILKKHHTESKETLLLNPIARIHLHHDLMDYIEPAERPGNIKYVYIFSALAIFLLIIACINFMNLVTARSGYRAKEIALRKVVGAVKMDLIKQFLGESILLSFIALALAIGLVELLLPTFSALSGKPLTVNYTRDVGTILVLIGITLLTGIIAGSYPALVLSSFQPANVLKGSLKGSSKHSLFRKALVVFQFALTVFSIVATLVIYNQLHFVDTIDLGYDKENIVYIPLRRELRGKFDTIKNELLENENVLAVTGGSMPIEAMTSTLRVDWDGKDPDEKIPMHGLFVDYDYVETLKMEITQGRNFSRKFSSDATSGFLINEEAAKAMGMKSPVGKRLFFFRREGQIVGVVKNFHYGSLHNKIGPTVFQIDPVIRPYVCVRIKPTGSSGTIHSLGKIWKTFDPDYPFRYNYLDETISNFYKSEQRMGKIFNYFTFLALFISCLGLFGLASFMTQRRTKEIGIRKIVGATVPGIILLLIKEYKKWVIIANVIAWPVAYYTMSKWLQNFAYRTGIGIWIFLLAALFSLILVPFTVGYYSVKAALTNPVNALRYE